MIFYTLDTREDMPMAMAKDARIMAEDTLERVQETMINTFGNLPPHEKIVCKHLDTSHPWLVLPSNLTTLEVADHVYHACARGVGALVGHSFKRPGEHQGGDTIWVWVNQPVYGAWISVIRKPLLVPAP